MTSALKRQQHQIEPKQKRKGAGRAAVYLRGKVVNDTCRFGELRLA